MNFSQYENADTNPQKTLSIFCGNINQIHKCNVHLCLDKKWSNV